jgi:hypothetical protein
MLRSDLLARILNELCLLFRIVDALLVVVWAQMQDALGPPLALVHMIDSRCCDGIVIHELQSRAPVANEVREIESVLHGL